MTKTHHSVLNPQSSVPGTLRFLGLGAFTAVSAAGTSVALRASDTLDEVAAVDGLREAAPGGGEWPFVSIVVPARNEERNLPRLLPSLLGQRYPRYEVIVVDDQSEDATPAILAEWAGRDPKLRVIRGGELPEGWKGKPFAMHQGALAATGEWLLFTDADTDHAPLALSSTIAYAIAHHIDMLTILPQMELGTPSERLVMPIAVMGITALHPASRVNDPGSKVAIANGQYILVRREVYEAVGGAGRVKDKIAEDLEFAKAVKSDGYRLRVADGRPLLRVRMYTNFGELWEGWGKNVVLSSKDNPAVGFALAPGLFSLTAMPFVLLLWAARSWRRARKSGGTANLVAAGWLAALCIWNAALPFLYRRQVDKALGLPPAWTLTLPIGAFIFALLVLNSLIRLLTGKGVVWKGRTYGS
ncbi:MAG: glycosyltransferase [Chloroflexia bacterium]